MKKLKPPDVLRGSTRWLMLALAGACLACGGAPQIGSPGVGAPAGAPGAEPGAPAAAAGAGQAPVELDIADLRQTAADWPATLEKMRQDLAEVESFHASSQVPPLLKLEAWQRYLNVHGEDVPYSHEDDRLRQAARGHIEDLRLRTRFVDFDDGTLVDTELQKMWTRAGAEIGLEHAAEHCRHLTFGLGRYQDWRLPDFDELAELYDSSSTEQVKILGGIQISSTQGAVWASSSRSGCRQTSHQRGSQCPAFLFEQGRREQYPHRAQVLCVRDQRWPMASAKGS